MEDKWFMIGIAAIAFAMMMPVAIGEHSRNECRKAAIEKSMPADDIIKLCK